MKTAREAPAIATLLVRRGGLISAVLVLIATCRIAATYSVFSHTVDEPAHIACGMEWLDKGTYRYEAQHPPLARVAAAIGPYLLGIRSQGTPYTQDLAIWHEGLRILYHDHKYESTLLASRIGILPFFWIACLVVHWWARRVLGAEGAPVAVFLFTFLPPVLAHAGLATTDMALTAFTGASFLAGWIWLERRTAVSAMVFGAAAGLAILSKFSFLAFFPVCAGLALAAYWMAERPPLKAVLNWTFASGLLIAMLVAVVLVWAGYRFSFGRAPVAPFRLPAPELFQGIEDVRKHNAEGHYAYLLGQRSKFGFWNFFPVALGVKTPLAFLALTAFGIVLAVRRAVVRGTLAGPLAFAAGVLAVGMSSRINIGLRHILPIYLALSIVGAAAVLYLMAQVPKSRWSLAAVSLLVLWFAGSSLRIHPDYIAYFNEIAGDEPWKILVDSDLDWGQDIKRLGTRLREAGAEWVMFTSFAMADLEGEHGFPMVLRSDVPNPSPGWNAVSVTAWKSDRLMLYDTHPEVTPWPEKMKPGERVGKGILLWYLPPGNARPAALVEREQQRRR